LFNKDGAARDELPLENAGMKTQALVEHAAAGRIHLKRILVPTDFSPLANKALQYALGFAEQFHAEVTVVHVIEPEVPPAFDGFMIAPPPITNGTSASCAQRLSTLVKSLRTAGGIRIDSVVRCGLASIEIVDAAKEQDVDLIVIATHGYTGWKHFAIGSTAERVVRAAPCPVLVVRDKEHEFV
jgi:universal stress protein A